MQFKLCLIGFFLIITLGTNSQVPFLLRSTLGTGGGSVTVSVTGYKITLLQSIGQCSVTGLFISNNLELRQGFVQPFTELKQFRESGNRKITVWPNPFSSEIFLKLNDIKDIMGNIDCKITDMTGKVVYSEKILAEEPISINLSFLCRGIYILNFRKDNFRFIYKIIKD